MRKKLLILSLSVLAVAAGARPASASGACPWLIDPESGEYCNLQGSGTDCHHCYYSCFDNNQNHWTVVYDMCQPT